MHESQDPFSVLCQLNVVLLLKKKKKECLCVISCPTFLCFHLNIHKYE